MTILRAASIGALLLGACAIEENTSSVEQHLPPGGGCDDFGCGMNSPEIDNYGIHDFHGRVGGLPNKAGLQVVDLKWKNPACGGCAWKSLRRVYSAKGQIGATDELGFYVGVKPDGTYSGTPAENLRIFLKDASGTKNYEIKVGKSSRPTYWAQRTGWDFATAYLLEWDVVVSPPSEKRPWKNVCTNPPQDGSPDLLGMNSFHSVVFEDDAIDSTTKRVKRYANDPYFAAPSTNSNWVNVGCAGHALAKLHLSGHTTGAVKQVGFALGAREFQTTLKMIVADYCGEGNPNEGYPFTVAGQPLEWLDRVPYNTYSPGFLGKKEAEWTDQGATCLNKPRIIANPTPDGTAAFPDLEGDILLVCGARPPNCANDDPYSLNGHHLISSNPS